MKTRVSLKYFLTDCRLLHLRTTRTLWSATMKVHKGSGLRFSKRPSEIFRNDSKIQYLHEAATSKV